MALAEEFRVTSKDDDDDLLDLVSRFSQMKITITSDDTEEKTDIDDGVNSGKKANTKRNEGNDRFLKYFTFHKDFPNILASLANGKTITILDNRIRDTEFVYKGESSLLPVPYKNNPLAALCDDNTIISYDNVNHIIKLWDLRKNCLTYDHQDMPKNVLYLRPTGSNKLVVDDCKQFLDENFNDLQNNSSPALDFDDNSANKYNLNYSLNWSEGRPSVVITYPEQKIPRRSSVVIEELPDDWIDPQMKSEILPILYKHSGGLKRKHNEIYNEILDQLDMCKKPLSNCTDCDKPVSKLSSCDGCNWARSKRKSTEGLHPENKRLHTTNGYSRVFPYVKQKSESDSVKDWKGKRKIDDELSTQGCKKFLLEDCGKRTLQTLQQDDNHKLKVDGNILNGTQCAKRTFQTLQDDNHKFKVDGNILNCSPGEPTGVVEGKSDCSRTVNLPKYMFDSISLNSIFTTENLDWKTKLRKENCVPKPAKMPKLLV